MNTEPTRDEGIEISIHYIYIHIYIRQKERLGAPSTFPFGEKN